MTTKQRSFLLGMVLVLAAMVPAARGEILTIPVTKDGGYDWRGWFSSDYGYLYSTSSAKAHFYADILSQITASGKATTVYSATFHYYVANYYEIALPYTIQAFRITADWNEDTGPVPATGEGYGSYSGSQLTGWFSLDVKDLVQAWADGTYTNFGLMLTDPVNYAAQAIVSREGTTQYRPYFVIEYALSPIVEVNIPVAKDSCYDWRGWFSHDGACVSVAGGAKAYFQADLLSQITAPGRITRVLSASLNYKAINYWENSLPYTIQAFRVGQDWDENTGPVPTYGEGYGTYTGSQLTGWFSLDLKNLVQAWVDGAYSNYGVVLIDTVNYASQALASRENTTENRPYFTVRYALSEVTRGHRLLLQKGLQIQALTFPGLFTTSRISESNFTTANVWECEYPVAQIGTPPGPPWARWTTSTALLELTANELPYLPSLVSLQYYDELDLNDPATVPTVRDWAALTRQRYPEVIAYTNLRGTDGYEDMKAFIMAAQPDMIMSSWYVYDPVGIPPWQGGSPITLYEKLQIFRRVGLDGLDGNGAQPIPYAVYIQTASSWIMSDGVHGRTPSESELRLNEFVAWTFGYKYVCAFVYSSTGDYAITSSLFNGLGDSSPTPVFYQMAELNRQGKTLGPALVRLISTDVRMKMGRHHGDRNHWWEFGKDWEVDNTLPAGLTAWSTSADPYMTAISVSNPGNYNTYIKDDLFSSWTVRLPGDVVLGYFKPLDESYDGSTYNNQKYFMITNGLTDAAASAAGATQTITIDFNFGSSGITGLQRMRRSDGAVETITAGGSYTGLTFTSLGGTSYRLVLTLEGGTGDLFKYNTGAPFVGSGL